MRIKEYAVFFSVIFSLFLTVPSIMRIVEKRADTSYFFNGAAEEKKGESETEENTLVYTFHVGNYDGLHGVSYNIHNHCHTSKTYPDVILDKTLPPPEIS